MDDNEQFIRLWTQAEPIVAGYLRVVLGDPHATKDVLQDVAILVYKKFDQYDPNRKFSSWAIGFARLSALSYRRKQGRYFLAEDDAILDRIADICERQEDVLEAKKVALRDCLKKVPENSRAIVDLRYWRRMKAEDIAATLGKKASSVRSTLCRVRSSLLHCIRQHHEVAGGQA